MNQWKLFIPALPAALALVGCEVVMQWDGWAFWRQYYDHTIGPVLSVLLGCLAAWFWFRQGAAVLWTPKWWGWLVLGTLASSLLLIGPIYQVAKPLLAAQQAEAVRPQRLEIAEKNLSKKQTELDYYLQMAASGRIGWQGHIDQARANLAELELKHDVLLVPVTTEFNQVVVLAATGLAVILFQVAAALLAGQVSAVLGQAVSAETPKTFHPKRPETFHPKHPAPETKHPTETPQIMRQKTPETENDVLVKRLQNIIKISMAESKMSLRQWCEREGLQPATISMLGNHFRLKNEKKETISAPKLAALAGRYLLETVDSAEAKG